MWVYMVNPEIDGETLIAPAAVEVYEARGWVVAEVPTGLDLDDPHAPTTLRESRVVPAGHLPAIGPKLAVSEPVPPAPEKPVRSRPANTTNNQEEDNGNG